MSQLCICFLFKYDENNNTKQQFFFLVKIQDVPIFGSILTSWNLFHLRFFKTNKPHKEKVKILIRSIDMHNIPLNRLASMKIYHVSLLARQKAQLLCQMYILLVLNYLETQQWHISLLPHPMENRINIIEKHTLKCKLSVMIEEAR